jgi:two-component system, cell cycle sensor histidine kinase and response regulator CckA
MTGARILIVEDENIVAEDLRTHLGSLGYEVVGVTAYGEKAVTLAETLRPDLVLMDIKLKGSMEGIAAAELIRARCHLPVVYLTAYADDSTLVRACVTEPSGYILKPFEERTLRTAIEMALYKHQAERQLKNSERRYAATLSSIGEGVIAVDDQARVTFLNPMAESLTGWPAAEAQGRPLDDLVRLVRENTRQPVANPLSQVGTGNTSLSRAGPLLLLCRDGRATPVEDSISPIRDDAGAVTGVVLVFHDISERRRADQEQRLMESRIQRMQQLESLSVLAGGIAHDFNNLLTPIVGYAEMAEDQLPAGSPLRPMIQTIGQSAQHASELIQQLLAYAGKGQFLPQPVNLSSLVQEMTPLLETVVGRRGALILEPAGALPLLNGDLIQVRQVVLNLLINAAEALTDSAGRITVRTGVTRLARAQLDAALLKDDLAEGPYVYLEVIDTGSGMSPDTQLRIFDPFFTTRFTGRGLGLAAVLGIVRSHRGTIKVTSAPGQGSTFQVFFPCSVKETPPQERPAVAEQPWRGSGTILVVEDEPSILSLAQRILESAGLTVLIASNGRAGVELFRQRMNDIAGVLLDMTMPRMNGLEAFQELRQLRPDVRVLLMSGYSEEEVSERFAGLGLAGFVSKPFIPRSLLAALRRVLEG